MPITISPYGKKFGRRKPGPWARLNSRHPFAVKGILGCWLFNEGGGLPRDLSGRSKNLTMGAGSAKWGTSQNGSAFKFDGANWLSAGANFFTSATYTIGFRIMPAVVNSYQGIISCRTTDADSAEVFIEAASNQIGGPFASANGFVDTVAGSINANTWYTIHLVVQNGNPQTIYLNGTQNATASNATTAFATFSANTLIGNRTSGGFPLANGTLLDWMMVFPWAMTAGDVGAHALSPFSMLVQPAASRGIWGPGAAAPVVSYFLPIIAAQSPYPNPDGMVSRSTIGVAQNQTPRLTGPVVASQAAPLPDAGSAFYFRSATSPAQVPSCQPVVAMQAGDPNLFGAGSGQSFVPPSTLVPGISARPAIPAMQADYPLPQGSALATRQALPQTQAPAPPRAHFAVQNEGPPAPGSAFAFLSTPLQAVGPSTVVYRKTRSTIGTRTGSRQSGEC